MKTKIKRFACLFLVVLMMVAMLPVSVAAEENPGTTGETACEEAEEPSASENGTAAPAEQSPEATEEPAPAKGSCWEPLWTRGRSLPSKRRQLSAQ